MEYKKKPEPWPFSRSEDRDERCRWTGRRAVFAMTMSLSAFCPANSRRGRATENGCLYEVFILLIVPNLLDTNIITLVAIVTIITTSRRSYFSPRVQSWACTAVRRLFNPDQRACTARFCEGPLSWGCTCSAGQAMIVGCVIPALDHSRLWFDLPVSVCRTVLAVQQLQSVVGKAVRVFWKAAGNLSPRKIWNRGSSNRTQECSL